MNASDADRGPRRLQAGELLAGLGQAGDEDVADAVEQRRDRQRMPSALGASRRTARWAVIKRANTTPRNGPMLAGIDDGAAQAGERVGAAGDDDSEQDEAELRVSSHLADHRPATGWTPVIERTRRNR